MDGMLGTEDWGEEHLLVPSDPSQVTHSPRGVLKYRPQRDQKLEKLSRIFEQSVPL